MIHTFSRRDALKSTAAGFGYLAFAGLSTLAAEKNNPLAPKKTHFPAKAKHVIFLCMEGAPSHVDTFDYKPKLAEMNGKSMPRARTFAKLLASPWKFQQHGQSGLWISELFPELAKHADDRFQSMGEVIRTLEAWLGVHHAGTYSPQDEQITKLETYVLQFNQAPAVVLRRRIVGGFFATCTDASIAQLRASRVRA